MPAPAAMRIWAPWREAFVTGAADGAQSQCIFCFGRLTQRQRRARLVLHDGPDALVMMNLYPYTGGHIMVAPRRHVASPELLESAERAALGDVLAESIAIIKRVVGPHGLNVGANLGRVAGAGIASHMHWHVVPRWEGDNNFMPVLASTRVVSHSLEENYRRLRPVFTAMGGRPD
jgi:ATP adenylyltransferase